MNFHLFISDGKYYEVVKANFERADRNTVVRTSTNCTISNVYLLTHYKDLVFNWSTIAPSLMSTSSLTTRIWSSTDLQLHHLWCLPPHSLQGSGLQLIYNCTIFDVYLLTHYKDLVFNWSTIAPSLMSTSSLTTRIWSSTDLQLHHLWCLPPHSLQGSGLQLIYNCTIFDVYLLTHYKDLVFNWSTRIWSNVYFLTHYKDLVFNWSTTAPSLSSTSSLTTRIWSLTDLQESDLTSISSLFTRIWFSTDLLLAKL